MNRLFLVTLYLNDGSKIDYRVIAENDVEARQKALEVDKKSWNECNDSQYIGIRFATIQHICDIDIM